MSLVWVCVFRDFGFVGLILFPVNWLISWWSRFVFGWICCLVDFLVDWIGAGMRYTFSWFSRVLGCVAADLDGLFGRGYLFGLFV